ncbi:MAG: FAD-binding oxidoreductase [Parachlamydiaceae bacterium]|nr:FAD-binding oxidoreductase [Parachlamydiaceae bacterium]
MWKSFSLAVCMLIAVSLDGAQKMHYDFSNYYHTEVSSVVFPKTFEDVQNIVLKAAQQKKKIAVAGAKMSQGGHTLPSEKESFLVNTKFLNKVEVFSESKSARVGPGATWKDVQDAAHANGLAVKVMQASNIFSIGGSLSTNIHGWDHISGALVETVRSVTIVDAFGNVQILTPEDELFSLVIGGYGMFGIIVEAEIELADNVVVERKGVQIPTEEYAEYFNNKIDGNAEVILHYARLVLDPTKLFENVIVVDYVKNASSYKTPLKLPAEPPKGHWYERVTVNFLRKNRNLISLKQAYDNVVFLKPKVMSRNEAMLPNIRFVYDSNDKNADMLQEFFVPKHNLMPFLQELKATLEEYDIHLFNATIRHVKQDHLTALPYAKTDVFAIVLYYNESLDVKNLEKIEAFTGKAVDNAISWQGSYYLPYHRFPTLAQFQEVYPEFAYVLEKKQQHDPQDLFSSQFSKHYLKNSTR